MAAIAVSKSQSAIKNMSTGGLLKIKSVRPSESCSREVAKSSPTGTSPNRTKTMISTEITNQCLRTDARTFSSDSRVILSNNI